MVSWAVAHAPNYIPAPACMFTPFVELAGNIRLPIWVVFAFFRVVRGFVCAPRTSDIVVSVWRGAFVL